MASKQLFDKVSICQKYIFEAVVDNSSGEGDSPKLFNVAVWQLLSLLGGR
jgi:hypothetical protein